MVNIWCKWRKAGTPYLRNSLRWKLMVIFMGLGIFPLLIAGLVGYQISYRGFYHQAVQQVGDLPQQAGQRVESFLYYRYSDVQNVAALPMVANGDWEVMNDYFLRLVKLYESYAWFGLLDADGRVRAASGRWDRGLVLASEQWFQQTIATGQVMVEDIRWTDLSSEPVLGFTAPVKDASGRVTGVVHAEVKASEVWRYLETIKTGATGETFLVDGQGRIIADSSGILPEGSAVLTGMKAFQLAADGQTGVTDELFAGRQWIIGYLPLHGHGPYPGLGWMLMVFQDAEAVLAPARTQGRIAVFVLLGAGIIIFLVTWLLARGITRPLAGLAGAARMIAAGNYQVTLPRPVGDDELGQLGSALQTMLDALLAEQQQLARSNQSLLQQQLVLEGNNRELVNANRLKSEFLGNISHELVTPVSAIMAFAEMVLSEEVGRLNDKQREYMQEVMDSSKELHQLITNLLDMNQLESATLRINPAPVHLEHVFAEIRPLLEVLALRKELTLNMAPVSGVPPVLADVVRLKQVFINLVSNAIKFTPPMGRIKVRAITDELEPGCILIQVADSGIGIPLEDQLHIFDRFYQVDSSWTRAYGGAGVGLALVRELVELHRGRVWVQSIPGHGSTFTFTLPLAEPALPTGITLVSEVKLH